MSANLALYTTPATNVTADGVEKQKTTVVSGVFLTFEGDQVPRGFRGSAIADVWNLQLIFGPENYAGAQATLDLLELAYNSADARITLTPGGLDDTDAWICEVHGWSRRIQKPSGITFIDCVAQEVRG